MGFSRYIELLNVNEIAPKEAIVLFDIRRPQAIPWQGFARKFRLKLRFLLTYSPAEPASVLLGKTKMKSIGRK
ncbi:MAG: hypothetical protein QM642_04015 [Edaphocola sp.]